MRDAPRCHIHLEEISKLYCETWGNLPICVACMHGEHKGHSLIELKALARLKREELVRKLKPLEKYKEENALISLSQAEEKLMLNVTFEKEKVIRMHEEKDQNIMTKIQDTEGRKQQLKQDKQNAEQKILDSLQTEMEHEIHGVKKKYGEIFKVKKCEINHTFQAQESSLEKELAKLRETRERFKRERRNNH
ncbi:hypothetical protein HOLleu_25824 [Holothuria leucospilota]|uniref:B box-type domain-containing protein n=1 Tax=Holothuria leucospilota TaxID=206669 RepID=A0A9Q1H4T0_HOLLE|nr:hypothetical protein HOLleu_25824 [Holothuria leucospilota]